MLYQVCFYYDTRKRPQYHKINYFFYRNIPIKVCFALAKGLKLPKVFLLTFSTEKVSGQGWIRTIVVSRRQIYSLLPLATRAPTHLPLTGLEPVTSPLPRECATAALQRLLTLKYYLPMFAGFPVKI